MALLEGQAAGLPVLAGASGGVAGVVADGVTGRLVPASDVDAFAAALAELLAKPERRRALAAAAAARIAAAHGIEAASHRLDAILQGLAGARR
jgi:glycosyltransferase involved in cell wall biosynthesis